MNTANSTPAYPLTVHWRTATVSKVYSSAAERKLAFQNWLDCAEQQGLQSKLQVREAGITLTVSDRQVESLELRTRAGRLVATGTFQELCARQNRLLAIGVSTTLGNKFF